jgi:hypothetical protein
MDEEKSYIIGGIKYANKDDLVLKNALIKSVPLNLYNDVLEGIRPRECVLLGTYNRFDIDFIKLREFDSERFFNSLLKLKKKTAIYTKNFYNFLAIFELCNYMFDVNSTRRDRINKSKEKLCSMINNDDFDKYFDSLHLRVAVGNRAKKTILKGSCLNGILKRSSLWHTKAEIDDMKLKEEKRIEDIKRTKNSNKVREKMELTGIKKGFFDTKEVKSDNKLNDKKLKSVPPVIKEETCPAIVNKKPGEDVNKTADKVMSKKEKIRALKESKKIAQTVPYRLGSVPLGAISSKLKVKKDISGPKILECVLPHSQNFVKKHLQTIPGHSLSDMTRKLFAQHCGCFLEYLALGTPLTVKQNTQFVSGIIKPLEHLSELNGCHTCDVVNEILDHQILGLKTWPLRDYKMFSACYPDWFVKAIVDKCQRSS